MKPRFFLVSTSLIVLILLTFSCQIQTDYEPQINALRASRDSLATALKETNANLQSTNNTLASLTSSVSTIQAQLAVISGQITTLNAQLTSTNSSVAGQTNTIASIQSQIKVIQDQIAVLNAQQTATSNAVSGLSATVTSIQSQIISILSQVGTLNSQNTALNKTISDISNTLALSNNQLNIMVTQLNAILAKVATLNDIDGNVYKTVIIGTQVWMAENLKTKHYSNGDSIPNVTNTSSWTNQVKGAWCDFGNSTSNGTTYGHLYNFYTVVDSRKLCPNGWHVPSTIEWSTLTNFLGGGKIAGSALKETGTLHWSSPNTSTNSSGFSALAGSWRGGDGIFYYAPTLVAYFWSSTSYSSIYSSFFNIEVDNSARVITSDPYFSKNAGCNIRCIKD